MARAGVPWLLGASFAGLVAAALVLVGSNPWLLLVLVGPFAVLVAAFHAWRRAERLMTEVALERERLDRLVAEGEQLVARVSRELRGPLTPIRGFAAALARRGEGVDPEVRRLALEQIADRAVHMSHLIDDLLITTHGSHDGDEPVRRLAVRAVDVVAGVRGTAELFRGSHPRRTFQVTAAEPVPLALADDTAVEQIVLALLSNACRYSPPRSPVTVYVGHDGTGAVTVAVTDRGPGVPADERDRIFERFHRMRRCGDPGGLGLGLYVARQLAVAMDGRIDLDSYEGDGSTFTLSLPVAEAPAQPRDPVEVRF